MPTLLENLLEFHKNDPNDPFIVYGLALEYGKTNTQKANGYFELLLEQFPNYLATYYTAAHHYWEQENHTKAAQLFEKGIMLASEQNNPKALKELQAAHQNFIFDTE
jgi:tetratricopeptide (TPR) repeat protein